ncbi:hypothetical protein SAMN04488084_11568 [Pedobacter antarcticus]|nr:hypothetical protein SAMN04488084_11568 [Pedobacter antarcticus]
MKAINRMDAITIRTTLIAFFKKGVGGKTSLGESLNDLGLYFLFLFFFIIYIYETDYFEISPAIILMLRATMMVLNAKAKTPCIQASLLILLEVICTSETWKVMPITKEK